MIKQIALATLIPGAFALAVMLLAWRPWAMQRAERSSGAPSRLSSSHWGGGVALAGGLLIGFFILEHRLPFLWPPEKWQWLIWLTTAAGIIGIGQSLIAQGWRQRALCAVALAAAAAIFMRHPSSGVGWSWKVLMAGAVVISSGTP